MKSILSIYCATLVVLVGLVMLDGCAALSPAKYQEDALALAYSACVKDPEVKKAAEQAGTTSEQLCALVMNAVVKQLEEQQAKAACDGGESGSCSP